jgi:DNA-binding transcriptional ArsR family regulator
MAPAATTTDPFTAIADGRRRQLLDLLAGEELPVGELVRRLGVAQPVVSKHLKVLREVGLVDAREDGRQRLYRLNASPLRHVHAWVSAFERTWSERFDRLDAVLTELQSEERTPDAGHDQGSGDAAERHVHPDHP